MNTKKSTSRNSKVIAMSAKTKKRIADVAKQLNGKDLFVQKVDLAKKTLSDIKSLPI